MSGNWHGWPKGHRWRRVFVLSGIDKFVKIKIKQLVLGVLIIISIFSGVFFISKLINQYHQQQLAKEQEYQSRIQTNFETIALLEEESEQLAEESDTRIRELNKRFESELNSSKEIESQIAKETRSAILQMQEETQQQIQGFEQKIKELEEGTSQSPVLDLVSIVEQWRPIIVFLNCDFRYSDTSEIYLRTSGSGIIAQFTNQVIILTNKHILIESGNYGTYSCSVEIPDTEEVFISTDYRIVETMDLAVIYINNPDEKIKELGYNTFLRICQEKPSIGDAVIILGYPTIGSEGNITATEGIISGYDGDYFITSAKIEKGNSGGAAISVQNDCLLGIPTFVRIGDVESLGRILDLSFFR